MGSVHRLKSIRTGDDIPLVAEMLQYVPDVSFHIFLIVFDGVLKELCNRIPGTPLAFGCGEIFKWHNYHISD